MHRPGVDVSLAELLGMRAGRRVAPRGEIVKRVNAQAANRPVSRGLDVSEVRRYQPGDEVRAIDWKVTARRSETHVKVFEDERARTLFLWVDLRHAMRFGTRVCLKSVLAARLAAGLGWQALRAGDRVGAWIVTDQHVHKVPEFSDETGIKRLCHALASRHADAESDASIPMSEALSGFSRGALGKADWQIISDFEDVSAELRFPRRVALTCWHLVDPLDASLPERSGWLQDRIGVRRLAVSKGARERHAARHRDRVEHLQRACAGAEKRYVQLSTRDGDPLTLRRLIGSGSRS